MRSHLRCLIAVVLSCCALAPARLHAEEPPAQAKEHFLAGRDAMRRGELAQALALFERSYALHPTAGTLINLATCEERLGRIGSAFRHFDAVQAQLPIGDDRRGIAAERVAALDARVPRLRIDRAPGAPANMNVVCDGVAVEGSMLGLDLPFDPGVHTVTVMAPGRPERHYEVTLAERDRRTLTVEPTPVALPPVPPPFLPVAPILPSVATQPAPSVAPTVSLESSNRQRTAGFVVGGGGVLGLGVSAVLGGLAIQAHDELTGACPDPKRCNEAGLDLEKKGKAFAAASTTAFIVGLTGTAAGALLVLLSAPNGRPAVSVVTAFRAGGAEARIQGAF